MGGLKLTLISPQVHACFKADHIDMNTSSQPHLPSLDMLLAHTKLTTAFFNHLITRLHNETLVTTARYQKDLCN